MTDLSTRALNINRTQNHRYRFLFSGLLPKTVHKVYVDGVDYSYAVRQVGKDFGDPLVSDESGSLQVYMLYEVPYNRSQNFELPQTPTLSYQEQIVNNQNTRRFRTAENYVLIEAKSSAGNSYAQYSMPLTYILTAGSVDTLYPTD